MSAFVLKIIALISMTCDHLSYVIFRKFSFLNYIGRIAFPIFAFQISEGYAHTKNLKKYLLRLFVFALISQAPFALFKSAFSSSFALNIFFTLFLGLIAITVFEMFNKLDSKNKYVHYLNVVFGLICTAAIACVAEVIHCDYGYYGIVIIFVFHIFKKNRLLMNISFVLWTIVFYLKNLIYSSHFEIYLLIILYTCLSLAFINLYNNKKGKDIKYLLYLFYPIHLLIFYALTFVIS